MNQKSSRIPRHYPSSFYLLISIFFIGLFVVTGITVVDYTNTQQFLKENEKPFKYFQSISAPVLSQEVKGIGVGLAIVQQII